MTFKIRCVQYLVNYVIFKEAPNVPETEGVLRTYFPNKKLGSGVQNVIERIAYLKLSWVGNLAKTGRWTKRIVDWRTKGTIRRLGRPPTR